MAVEFSRAVVNEVAVGGRLRLGLFDPDPDRKLVVYVGHAYPDTREGRLAMHRSVEKFNRMVDCEGFAGVCMGVFKVQA